MSSLAENACPENAIGYTSSRQRKDWNHEVIRVNDQYDVPWRPNITVQDVLDALKFSFRMIAVKINGQPVLRRDFAITEVPDGAEMQAIHMISGG